MILDELGAYLEGQGLGVRAQDLYLGSLPESPDEVIALQETGAGPSVYVHEQASPSLERPTLQVLSRSESYESARTKAQSAYRMLSRLVNSSLPSSTTLAGSRRYLKVTPLQTPFSIGPDQNNRHRIVFNIQVLKEAE